MSQSTVLPPAQSKPAEIAATSGRDGAAPAASDADGSSFGNVLQAQMDKQASAAETRTDDLPTPTPIATVPDLSAVVLAETPATNPLLPGIAPIVSNPPSTPEESAVATDNAATARFDSLPAIPGDRSNAVLLPSSEPRSADNGKMRKLHASDPVGNETPPDPRAIVTQAEIGPTRLRAVTHEHELGAGSDATLAPSVAVPGSAEASRHPLGLADARKDVPTAPVKLEVSQPLQASTWRESFADRVTWVANARQPAAEMQINPPNLGPVEIRVNVSADQANLSFYSPHAAVREAIQAALPRLQDSLSASGLTLGNVFVGAEAQSRQHPGNGEHSPRGGAPHGGDFPLSETPAAGTWVRPGGGLGRVDLFA